MANRLVSSTHTVRSKNGIKNRGIARTIKTIKRVEAQMRQQRNIDRGYSVTDRSLVPYAKKTPAPIEQF